MVEVRGVAIELQFLHPAAKLMFSQNSIAAGHTTNRAAGETPNFFFALPGAPKPFYDALSDAVVHRRADASLPARLARTYTSKGWAAAAIPPALRRYADKYADQTRVDAHFSSFVFRDKFSRVVSTMYNGQCRGVCVCVPPPRWSVCVFCDCLPARLPRVGG